MILKDGSTVHIGLCCVQDLVETTEKVYNCETVHLATAHRTLSKALMAQQGYLTDDSYYHHAMEAIRIARSQLSEGHALLHPYLTNFGEWSLRCVESVLVTFHACCDGTSAGVQLALHILQPVGKNYKSPKSYAKCKALYPYSVWHQSILRL